MKNVVLLLILVILIFTLSTITFYVDRNNGIPDVFQIFFPEQFVDQEAEKARETEMAPFAAAENAAQPVELDPEIVYSPLGNNTSIDKTLDLAHMHEAAISQWLKNAVAEILTIKLADNQTHANEVARFLSVNGLKEFETFLDATNIIRLIQSKNFDLNGFVTDVPELKMAGVAGGRYRWLYDVPVNLTFLPSGTKSYENLETDDYRSEFFVLRVQLGRVEKGKGVDGLVIETWEALKRKQRQ